MREDTELGNPQRDTTETQRGNLAKREIRRGRGRVHEREEMMVTNGKGHLIIVETEEMRGKGRNENETSL